MSTNDPSGPGNPFEGLLGDLLKVLGSAQGGRAAWLEAARSLAQGLATDGGAEANPDPLERISLEAISQVAELHVASATGLAIGPGPGTPVMTPVGRGTWAQRALDAWAPLLREMVEAMPATGGPPAGGSGGPLSDLFGSGGTDAGGGGLPDIFGQLSATMGPLLVGMQLGSAVGHLAHSAHGQYVLPLPWPSSGELLVVPANISAYAEDWSLPRDEVALWASAREMTMHAVVSRPHVRGRLAELVREAVHGAAAAQQAIMDRLGEHASDPESLQRLLGDPETILPELVAGAPATSDRLTALAAVVTAYADHVAGTIAGTLTGSGGALVEAWHRHRVEGSEREVAAGALFGMDLEREQADRGAGFVRGVIDRAGEDGLARLWTAPRFLPTPSEVDAPGLWLERIDLPDPGDPGGGTEPGSAG